MTTRGPGKRPGLEALQCAAQRLRSRFLFMATESAPSIALLIDCDNVRPDSIRGILDELAKHGSIHFRRAYG